MVMFSGVGSDKNLVSPTVDEGKLQIIMLAADHMFNCLKENLN
jgi:hypothetical protein